MLLEASELALGYAGEPLIQSVSFQVEPGDVLAVVGHNGSGKSTLAKTLLGVIPPLGGALNWPQKRPKTISYLGQRTEFDSRFPLRVRDLAAMGAWHGLGFLGHLKKGKTGGRDPVQEAMERTNIAHIADYPLHVLSAGQLQRALFARTMVQDAPLILLDEPFTAIDQTTEAQLLDLIDDWAAEDRAIILVLHDLSAVLQHCNKALLLGNGRALYGSPREVLTPANLVSHGYISASQATWMEGMYSDKSDEPTGQTKAKDLSNV
ncbi:MAG: metal ABC transporter ATP-binding protein [Rhizobiales bacterium]|nr:metal ABC transporter ATP-binding protein [Hyphomicrobiales bacterium]